MTEETTDLATARRRLQGVADGETLQHAYGVEDSYDPIGDILRADLRAVLRTVAE